jgi:hypothetical protein
MRLFSFWAALVLSACAAYGGPILYTFTGTTLPSSGSPAHSEVFQLKVPDFLALVVNGPLAQFRSDDAGMISCVPCAGPPVSAVSFLRGGAGDSIQFQDQNGTGYFYLFGENAFSTVGTHQTLPGINVNTGTLVVEAVPEPSTFGLLVIGLSTVALRLRNRGARAGSRAGAG